MKDKILITGGSGFIGSNLLKKFGKKKIIIVSCKKKISGNKNHIFINCDLKSRDKVLKLFKKIKPDLVYHFAWEGIPKFNKINFNKNKLITENLISAINISSCKRIVVAGSCAEYCHSLKKKKLIESFVQKKKLSNLGNQKNLIRNIFVNKLDKSKIFIWARIFYVYGPGQREGSLLNSILKSFNEKIPFKLNRGSVNNDFIYIDDVVSALYLLQKNYKSEIINICTSISTSNTDFIQNFRKITGMNSNLIECKSHKNLYLIGSNRKLKLYGWKPKYNLLTGIKKSIKYFNNAR